MPPFLLLQKKKKRNFVETIEIQIGLKGFDPARDKRLNANVLLPLKPKRAYKICLFGNENQCDEAALSDVPHKNQAELKAFKRNKKLVKKMAKSYDMFVASSTLLKKIPRLLGPTLQNLVNFLSLLVLTIRLSKKLQKLNVQSKDPLNLKLVCLCVCHLPLETAI